MNAWLDGWLDLPRRHPIVFGVAAAFGFVLAMAILLVLFDMVVR